MRVNTVFLILLLISGSGCISNREPEAIAQIDPNVFLTEDDLPEAWVLRQPSSGPCVAAPLNSGCKSIDAGDVSFGYSEYPGGTALQLVYLYAGEIEAAQDFGRLREDDFGVNSTQTEWEIPPELPYESPIADQYYFGCQDWGGEPYCQMIGQYQAYIVEFGIRKHIISFDDLEKVLEAIDRRMEAQLPHS